MGKKLLGAAMALAIFSAALLLPGWEWVRGKEKGGQRLKAAPQTAVRKVRP